MKLGFDAKRALNNGSGLGNYSRNLLNALMQHFPENEYLLFTPKAKDEFLNQLDGDFKLIFPDDRFQKLFHSHWRTFGIKAQLYKIRIDLYHGLSNEIPLHIPYGTLPTVVTIHDLIFLKHKEQYPFFDRWIYEFKTRYAAKCANKIIAVSGETKKDLIERYGIVENKIVVIPPPVDLAFQKFQIPNSESQLIQKYKLPSKYILNVGSFFPRKNQQTLIEAFDLIKNKTECNLVLVGEAGNTRKEIEALIQKKNLGSRIQILSGVSNEDLPSIYRAAELFVFPSLYEGFGMPVAEALFSKVPVITTKGGCFEEAGGKDSFYVNPSSAEEMASAILKVLGDGVLKTQMIENGWAHAQTMTSKIIAEKTMAVYREIVI